MNDRELFIEVFNNFQQRYQGLEMKGGLVYYNDECKFNIDGFNLCYNLLRLTEMLNNAGVLC
jgi:hypothetical protein